MMERLEEYLSFGITGRAWADLHYYSYLRYSDTYADFAKSDCFGMLRMFSLCNYTWPYRCNIRNIV